MNFRALKINEVNKWLQLCQEAFSLPLEYFERHFVNDPNRNQESIFVCEDKGNLVGSVRVLNREIYYNGQCVKMGGIGEVCTLPDYRGYGIASSLLKLAIEYMTENNYQVSVLGSGADKLYESFGYEHRKLQQKLLKTEMKDYGYIFGPLHSSQSDQLLVLYRNFSRKLNGPIARTPEYFSSWFMAEADLHQSLSIYLDKQLIGYVVYNFKEDINILELILDDGINVDEVLQNLLYHLSSKCMIQLPDVYDTNLEVVRKIVNHNWMYKNLSELDYSSVGSSHLIWRLDYY